MSIIITLLILGIGAALAFVVLGKTSRRPKRRRPVATERRTTGHGGLDRLRQNSAFRGVRIGKPGCENSRAVLDRIYEFNEAPELPLPGCSAAICTCHFTGVTEGRAVHRRTVSERREELRFDPVNPDRRSHKSRRRSDKWAR